MTSTQKLASILKQFVATNAPDALKQEVDELLDIHKAEAHELQEARDAIAALSKRVAALEQRTVDDDATIEEALKGFGMGAADEPTNFDHDDPNAAPAPEGEAPTETAEPVVESEAAE